MASNWYVLRSMPRCERGAVKALEREGFEVLFPKVQTPRPQGGYNNAPLFPGYLFIRLDWDDPNSPSVRRLPGVLGWVRFDGVVPHVPDAVISNLALSVESMNYEGGLWTRFHPGDKVLVVSGKMESLAEVLEEPSSPESRVRVLLEFMSRQVPAQVPWRNLRRVPEGSYSSEVPRARRTRGGGRWVRGFGSRGLAAAQEA